MKEKQSNAILLLSCPDQIGLVAKISGFIYNNGGNIISLHEHVNTDERVFFVRVVWDMSDFRISRENLMREFEIFASGFGAGWQIQFTDRKTKLAVFVSKYEHCLQELIWRQSLQEYPAEIVLIVSNHEDLRSVAENNRIPFYFFPKDKLNKLEQEEKEMEMLRRNQIDMIILARYMQILSSTFTKAFPNRIINIHHSFLPAFSGGRPYRQAFERGVKIIGATSHYVSDELDEGPIIEQDIMRITHRDTVIDLVRKGRDLERLVLARAVYFHVNHRVLINGRKTIVFE